MFMLEYVRNQGELRKCYYFVNETEETQDEHENWVT